MEHENNIVENETIDTIFYEESVNRAVHNINGDFTHDLICDEFRLMLNDKRSCNEIFSNRNRLFNVKLINNAKVFLNNYHFKYFYLEDETNPESNKLGIYLEPMIVELLGDKKEKSFIKIDIENNPVIEIQPNQELSIKFKEYITLFDDDIVRFLFKLRDEFECTEVKLFAITSLNLRLALKIKNITDKTIKLDINKLLYLSLFKKRDYIK